MPPRLGSLDATTKAERGPLGTAWNLSVVAILRELEGILDIQLATQIVRLGGSGSPNEAHEHLMHGVGEEWSKQRGKAQKARRGKRESTRKSSRPLDRSEEESGFEAM